MSRLMLVAALLLLAACSKRGAASDAGEIGDPERGRALIASHGCGACHEIPGVVNAVGRVGPPLRSMRARTMIAGVLPNTPPNMIRWLEAPQGVLPGNAMPNTGLNEHDARDIAAYLYTLR
jgi:cytochrome c2